MSEENNPIEESAPAKQEVAKEAPKKSKKGLIVLLIFGLIVAGAIAGGLYLFRNGTPSVESIAKDLGGKAVETAFYQSCMKEQDDKDLCKYMSNFKETKNLSAKSQTTFEGKTTQSTWESEGDDKSSIVSAADGKENFAMIVIGDTSYTKDYSDNKWWKVVSPKEVGEITEEVKPDTVEQLDKAVDQVANTTTYKKMGKEACGNLTCFKYQMVDTSTPDVNEYVWFDDKDYMLRKTRTETKDSGITETTYSYGSVSIKEPSPTKEGANLQELYNNLSNPDLESAQTDLQNQLDQYSVPEDVPQEDYSSVVE